MSKPRKVDTDAEADYKEMAAAIGKAMIGVWCENPHEEIMALRWLSRAAEDRAKRLEAEYRMAGVR